MIPMEDKLLDLFARLLCQIHQMDGAGQIRRAAADKEHIKLQRFSGFFHIYSPIS